MHLTKYFEYLRRHTGRHAHIHTGWPTAFVSGVSARLHGKPRRNARRTDHHQTCTGLPNDNGEELYISGDLRAPIWLHCTERSVATRTQVWGVRRDFWLFCVRVLAKMIQDIERKVTTDALCFSPKTKLNNIVIICVFCVSHQSPSRLCFLCTHPFVAPRSELYISYLH